MQVHHFPVLLWEDHDENVTGTIVGDADSTAVAATEKGALMQLKRYVTRNLQESYWYSSCGLVEPALKTFKVQVRAEYREDDQVYPCAELVSLPVACVHGPHENGLHLAVLPRLGIQFFHHARDDLKSLVNHYVQETLRGSTPLQLVARLPPVSYELESLVVRSPRPRYLEEKPPETLATVADPLAAREVRRRFSVPYERDQEVAELVQRLGHDRVSVLLIGESGSGKTAALVEAARKIERKIADEGEGPRRNRHWMTSASRLIAGMRYLGQWQERLEKVISEVQEIDGVLCIENLLELVTVGDREPSAGLGGFLIPYLREGELRVAAEVSPTELDVCRRLLPDLVELLRPVRLEDLDRTRALGTLNGILSAGESDRGFEVESNVPAVVHRLFRRFMPYEVFPGKAGTFLREALAKADIEKLETLDAPWILQRFTERTGLPEVFLRDEMPFGHEEVRARLEADVLAQEAAVESVAARVAAFKAGMNDPERPLGVFLFCGPTGVGKTQLARTLANVCFGAGGEDTRLVRLDMSEYATPGAATRLLRTPEGDPGPLVDRIRTQPFQVVLLDEVEKAEPEVFDVLLTLLDEGRLVDSLGRVAVFRSAFVIMTSNLGAGSETSIGFDRVAKPAYGKHVRDFFRPEFVNRIDETLVFSPLDEEAIRCLATRELEALSKREGFLRRKLKLVWTPEVEALLIQEGFDPRYGARPLQRTVEELVAVPAARLMVEQPELHRRTLRAEVDAQGRVTVRPPGK